MQNIEGNKQKFAAEPVVIGKPKTNKIIEFMERWSALKSTARNSS